MALFGGTVYEKTDDTSFSLREKILGDLIFRYFLQFDRFTAIYATHAFMALVC